ncbi:hypothetical protein J6590_003829 [Homalodisca vitripennis]|nr:hypothetical protein J6590_003829 [Homalodisca vitripennis]
MFTDLWNGRTPEDSTWISLRWSVNTSDLEGTPRTLARGPVEITDHGYNLCALPTCRVARPLPTALNYRSRSCSCPLGPARRGLQVSFRKCELPIYRPARYCLDATTRVEWSEVKRGGDGCRLTLRSPLEVRYRNTETDNRFRFRDIVRSDVDAYRQIPTGSPRFGKVQREGQEPDRRAWGRDPASSAVIMGAVEVNWSGAGAGLLWIAGETRPRPPLSGIILASTLVLAPDWLHHRGLSST